MTETTPPDLIIAGASTRACAFSALRAGLRPVCFDQFADADLQAAVPVQRVERYPHDLPRMMSQFLGVPWMYTGALENYPEIVAEISERHPLLGNRPDVLQRVRDPYQVTDWLTDAGLKVLALRRDDDPPPADGEWLIKPMRGSAGIGIRVWDETVSKRLTKNQSGMHCYFQRRVRGESYSALFVGDGRHARLLGVTRQLVGCPDFHAEEFHYCGSIGPAELAVEHLHDIESLGRVVAEQGRLVGLFGCDLVLHRDDATNAVQMLLIEINPRYPASAEIVERAYGCSTIAAHITGCDGRLPEPIEIGVVSRCFGKAIMYAPQQFAVPAGVFDNLLANRDISEASLPTVADVPPAGQTIDSGAPICTIFASGTSSADCESRLVDRARSLYESLLSGDV